MYKQGDILEYENEGRRKVLGVCGELMFVSFIGDYNKFWEGHTMEQLKGWKLVQSKFVPVFGEWYWFSDSAGSDGNDEWEDCTVDKYRLDIGNVHRNREELREYKKKLLELGK